MDYNIIIITLTRDKNEKKRKLCVEMGFKKNEIKL